MINRGAKFIANEEMKHIDSLIDQYIEETVLPMILPLEVSTKEAENIQRTVKAAISLDVYYHELEKLQDAFLRNINPNRMADTKRDLRDRFDALEYLLIKTHPEQKKYASKIMFSTSSRYFGAPRKYISDGFTWDNLKFRECIQNKKLEDSVKAFKDEITLEDFEEIMKSQPQADRILQLRRIFHNNGNLEMGLLSETILEGAEEMASKLYKTLKAKTYAYQSLLENEGIERKKRSEYLTEDEMKECSLFYTAGCARLKGMLNIIELSTNLKNCKTYHRENSSEKERIRNNLVAADLFRTMFCNLPVDSEQHPQALEKIIRKIEESMLENKNLKKTDFEVYIPRIKTEYQFMMESLKSGTLDEELSYLHKAEEQRKAEEQKKKEETNEQAENTKIINVLKAIGTSCYIAAAAITYTLLAINIENSVLPNSNNQEENIPKPQSKIEEQKQSKESSPIEFITDGVIGIISDSLFKDKLKEIAIQHGAIKNEVLARVEDSSLGNSEPSPDRPRRRRRMPTPGPDSRNQDLLVDVLYDNLVANEIETKTTLKETLATNIDSKGTSTSPRRRRRNPPSIPTQDSEEI